MAYDDGIKTAPIAYIGLMSVLVTFIIVMLLQVVFFGAQEEMLATDPAADRPPAELADLTARQLTQLTRREVVDLQRNVVTIGISRAMELVVQELAAGKTTAEAAGPPLPTSSPPAAPSTPAAEPPPTTEPPPTGGSATTPEPTQETNDAAQS